MYTPLYDYQESISNSIYDRIISGEIRGAYLGMEVGTGKTLTSLSVTSKLYEVGLIHNVVIICPVSKVDDWKADLKKEVPEIEDTFVTSFQSAWRDKSANVIHDLLYPTEIGSMVIIDEGHKMKTYDSKQSKFIQKICSDCEPYVLVLSATAQNKKYIDLYPQYKALGSKIFNLPPKDFKREYCVEQLNYNMVYSGKSRFPFNEIIDYRNKELMDKEIVSYTYYKKYESTYDRPIEIIQKFKMTSEMKYFKEKKVWPKLDEKELLERLSSGEIEDLDMDYVIANRPTLHHIYMRESCSGFIREKFLDKNPKLQWLDDFLDGFESRLVVFTNFINETKLVSGLCDKKKRHWCIYDGQQKDLSNWYEYDDCVAIVNVVSGRSRAQ